MVKDTWTDLEAVALSAGAVWVRVRHRAQFGSTVDGTLTATVTWYPFNPHPFAGPRLSKAAENVCRLVRCCVGGNI